MQIASSGASKSIKSPGWYAQVQNRAQEIGPFSSLDQVSLQIEQGSVGLSREGTVNVKRLQGPDLDRAAQLRQAAQDEAATKVAKHRDAQRKMGIATGILLAATLGYACLGAVMPEVVQQLPLISRALPFLPEAIRGAVLTALPLGVFTAAANLGRVFHKLEGAGVKPDEREADRISQVHCAESGWLQISRADQLGPATQISYMGMMEAGVSGQPTRFSAPVSPGPS